MCHASSRPVARRKRASRRLCCKTQRLDGKLRCRERCFRATRGDRYLIGRLCEHCALTAENRRNKRITRRDVDEAVEHLIAAEDENASRPLKETRRALESNPTALLDVLDILERGPMPPHKLRLGPNVGVDDLQLSGAVRVDATGEQQLYSIRNEIYEQYLRGTFNLTKSCRCSRCQANGKMPSST